tara:strand:+ start:1406 stop:1807 length:402 start_codon:yes stop_codon:yes gene_type:complete
MQLTKKRLKQIIKEEMNELLGMVGGEPGMEKQAMIDEITSELSRLEQHDVAMIHQNVMGMLKDPMIREVADEEHCIELRKERDKFDRGTPEYLEADRRFEEECEFAQSRGRDEEGNRLRPGDPDYGYMPPEEK